MRFHRLRSASNKDLYRRVVAAVAMLRVRGMSKRYGGKYALRRMNLEVPDGQICVLLGPNGAGKSTLLRLLSTLARPSDGDALIDDYSVNTDRAEVRKSIGVAMHETLLYEDLTAYENLHFYSRLMGGDVEDAYIDAVLKRVFLLHRRNDKVGSFSRGMKQRLSIARALINDPKVLLLDEPFSGLDVKSQDLVSSMLTEAASNGAIVLLTAHDPDMGHDLGERLLVLVDGKLRYDRMKASVGKGEFVEEYRKLAGATK